ncbi:hypothetical protein [Thiorhodococcus minor]|uniref:Phosphate ABC transporter substrate-binding protein n=1 Tax=Thiorhodococcus minor TaxID=57489 RepID=A0A6M0JX59_9GAMM|nr:hypothetical protein [Thiorhodococcus minor]NEV62090.1 hypothetical protein [Thiorhodococcus minor]
MKLFAKAIVLLLFSLATAESNDRSGIVVVMSANSGIEALTREQVINIFFGRFRKLPNGETAVPVDQPAGAPLKSAFYRQLVNKDLAEIRAYWARLVFSGRTAPPEQTKTEQEALQLLLEQPGAVGYLWEGSLPPRLRVVFDL